MKKPIILSLVFLLGAFASARGEQAHVTIETDGRAVVVWGGEGTIKGIMEWLETGELESIGYEETGSKIIERYGDSVRVEYFSEVGFEELSKGKKNRVPVREAMIRGLLPPIEGLKMDEALMVLGGFGFSAAGDQEFSMMPDAEKIVKLIEASGPLLVLTGTGPFDEIMIYRLDGEEQDR